MGEPHGPRLLFPQAAADSPAGGKPCPVRQLQAVAASTPFVWFDVAPLETRDRFSPTVETDNASVSCAHSRPAPGPGPWAPAPRDRHSAAAARSPYEAGGSTPSHEPPRIAQRRRAGRVVGAQQSTAEQTARGTARGTAVSIPSKHKLQSLAITAWPLSTTGRQHPSDPTSPAALRCHGSQVCHIRTPSWALGLPIDHNTGNSCEIGICEQRLCSMQQDSNNTSNATQDNPRQQQQLAGNMPLHCPWLKAQISSGPGCRAPKTR